MQYPRIYRALGILAISRALVSTFADDQFNCACQPSAFTLTLNFSLTCEDSTLQSTTPGIEEYLCVVQPRNVSDKVPVLVNLIEIAELNQQLQKIQERNSTGPFSDGATIEYTSIIADDGVDEPPRGLQIFLFGENAAGTEIENSMVILFTKDCGVYPLIPPGSQLGWTVVVSAVISCKRFAEESRPYQEFVFCLDFCDGTTVRSVPVSR
jgi:hypothetical protein